ncbi:kinase-like domain-containing protein [Fusarium tricinctum]|uniref:Kinase-like domain-containing protein n=1 Tax=Fusarium tricinctum TaxID=61284 RepID=A0A8K0WB20_9HYPO|nr:kinase-like domain-containing protein [Fusarium tricinctum]
MPTLGLPEPPGSNEGSPKVEEGWVVDPTTEDIRNTLQASFAGSDIKVEFFSVGAYNKLFQVTINMHTTYLLRVSLPVDPVHKTSSEIATLVFVATISEIPIPRPVLFCTHRETPTRLEWIMMTKLDGVTLHNVWPRLDPFQKSDAVRQIASFQLSLFQKRFSRIGNLYKETFPEPHRIVSIPFFQGGRAWTVNNRGPFSNSRQWIYARLSLQRRDAWYIMIKYLQQRGNGSLTREDFDRALYTYQLGRRIYPFIAMFFPGNGDSIEPTVLHHDDLHANNILANDSGTITGIVDWECVSTLPLWKACFYPKFLYAPPRHTPEESSYQDPDFLTAQDKLLRAVFLQEMERLSPDWMLIYRTSVCKRDLSFAVDKIGNEDKQPHIESWLSNLERNQVGPSLLDTIFEL